MAEPKTNFDNTPFKEIRKTLMQLQGVWPKTADVALLFSANKPTIPVYTYVKRVSKRLALAQQTETMKTLEKPSNHYANQKIIWISTLCQFCWAENIAELETPYAKQSSEHPLPIAKEINGFTVSLP